MSSLVFSILSFCSNHAFLKVNPNDPAIRHTLLADLLTIRSILLSEQFSITDIFTPDSRNNNSHAENFALALTHLVMLGFEMEVMLDVLLAMCRVSVEFSSVLWNQTLLNRLVELAAAGSQWSAAGERALLVLLEIALSFPEDNIICIDL